jgi:hypothetical protein
MPKLNLPIEARLLEAGAVPSEACTPESRLHRLDP